MTKAWDFCFRRAPMAVCMAAISASGPVFAQSAASTGLDSIHPQARVGSKVCMIDHEHYGESAPWVTRKGAEAAAIRNWSNFTAWEYGSNWRSYAAAMAKKMSCEQSSGMWVCKTTARPCRGGR